jgi:hypothetical protein
MFKKKRIKKSYNRETQKPILKCSICNGEKVAGFKDVQTGKFEEIMLIRNDQDLQIFMETYDIDAVEKEY